MSDSDDKSWPDWMKSSIQPTLYAMKRDRTNWFDDPYDTLYVVTPSDPRRRSDD